MKPPHEAIEYYGLDRETATMRDVILAVRADEAVHRSINHHFSDIPQYYDVHNDKIHISEDGFNLKKEEEIAELKESLQQGPVDTREAIEESKDAKRV